jgi:hypothetical protein
MHIKEEVREDLYTQAGLMGQTHELPFPFRTTTFSFTTNLCLNVQMDRIGIYKGRIGMYTKILMCAGDMLGTDT